MAQMICLSIISPRDDQREWKVHNAAVAKASLSPLPDQMNPTAALQLNAVHLVVTVRLAGTMGDY